MTELLTVKETAAYLRTSLQQVRRMIREGDLFAVKVGREYRHPPIRPGGVPGGEVRRVHLS